RDGDIASARTLAELEAASAKLDAVLGDVDRPAAIQPFEYIRNSAIEGVIAQSEILKVEFAKTRSQILVGRWVTAHSSSIEARAQRCSDGRSARTRRQERVLLIPRLSEARRDLHRARLLARAALDGRARCRGHRRGSRAGDLRLRADHDRRRPTRAPTDRRA